MSSAVAMAEKQVPTIVESGASRGIVVVAGFEEEAQGLTLVSALLDVIGDGYGKVALTVSICRNVSNNAISAKASLGM